MIEVIPLIMPRVETSLLIKAGHTLNGKVGRALDEKGIDVNSIIGTLHLIDELSGYNAEDVLSFSFLVSSPEVEIASIRYLTVSWLKKGSCAIITGTLAQWRSAIAVYCSDRATVDVRHIFNMVVYFFEQLKLKFPTKHPLGDGTWCLK